MESQSSSPPTLKEGGEVTAGGAGGGGGGCTEQANRHGKTDRVIIAYASYNILRIIQSHMPNLPLMRII